MIRLLPLLFLILQPTTQIHIKAKSWRHQPSIKPSPLEISTGSIMDPPRRGGRERKQSSKARGEDEGLSAAPVIPPKHPSNLPIDASIYGLDFLRRQLNDNTVREWIKHLDFVRLRGDDIKDLFWNEYLEKKYGQYLPPPKALQRDKDMIVKYLRCGLHQKQYQVEKYQRFDQEIITTSEQMFDIVNIAASIEYNMAGEVNTETEAFVPCRGFTFGDIQTTKMDDGRKLHVSEGFERLIDQSFAIKYNLAVKKKWEYGIPITGAILKGVKEEVAWTVEELSRDQIHREPSATNPIHPSIDIPIRRDTPATNLANPP
jgi:hypothetical protein